MSGHVSSEGGPNTVATGAATEELVFRKYRLTPLPSGEGASFDRRLIYIGTAPDNDLVLEDPTASRNHARLEFDASGYRLKDLSSKNGTFVGGVRVDTAWVPPGTTLKFGHQEVRFDLEDDEVQVELARNDRFGRLLGTSSQMREIFALLQRVAKSDVTVLVEGESGTGKELAAEALHTHSTRRDAPFVVFDCSAVQPELVESELFGHVKGAFTGAVADRKGVFGDAHGGTLFIDEIGELPLDLQPKLLRVLETGEVKAVGSNDRRRVDVRVVAATNRQLDKEVELGQFRQDLYYRLAVIRVRLPPLRQRPEDIPLLVRHFLEGSGAHDLQVGFETMQRLQAHAWPGNVRELRNYVERAVLLADDGRLHTQHLIEDGLGSARAATESAPGAFSVDLELPFKDAKARLVERFERSYWERLLEETDGNVSEAARRGGIHRKSLEYLLNKLDLR